MSRLAKILALAAVCAIPGVTAACGTEKIQVTKSQGAVYTGRCCSRSAAPGCHTLNAAGTHGSAPNVRTAQANSGPNFNVRCERPITRVLYAIENGGFSGAYMPQNIVVGQDAIDVAKFVATYAGTPGPQADGRGALPEQAGRHAALTRADHCTGVQRPHRQHRHRPRPPSRAASPKGRARAKARARRTLISGGRRCSTSG